MTMFHSLLQNSLYPTTCLTSRLIELYTMYARRVKRKASVPQGGIPSGNFADCKFKARFFSFSGKFEFANLSSKVYSVHPSVTSRGSITFPFDLDIFYPSSSRTIGWRKTVWNGSLSVKLRDIITIRATQKNRISPPVSSKSPGKKAFISFVSSGQPIVEIGKNPEENQVSSTSSSCVRVILFF